MRVLFFDTETTGLPLWREPSSHPGQPHIVDLSCEVRDDETMELIGSMDCIINPGVPISPEVAGQMAFLIECRTGRKVAR